MERRQLVAVEIAEIGEVAEIATRAGLPGRARLVGRALGLVPDGMELPWHRMLRASGQIAFPSGSRGFREQSKRLKAEGVEVRNGRVPLASFGLDANLDRALWGMPL